jgi:hypothetical protein
MPPPASDVSPVELTNPLRIEELEMEMSKRYSFYSKLFLYCTKMYYSDEITICKAEVQSKSRNYNDHKKVFGVIIFETFVSFRILKSVVGKDNGLKPIYVFKKDIDCRVDNRIFRLLQNLDTKWLRNIKLGMTHYKAECQICRSQQELGFHRFRAEAQIGGLSLGENPKKPKTLKQLKSLKQLKTDMRETYGSMIKATYALLSVGSFVSEEFKKEYGVILDFLGLLHGLDMCSTAVDAMIVLDGFFRKFELYYFVKAIIFNDDAAYGSAVGVTPLDGHYVAEAQAGMSDAIGMIMTKVFDAFGIIILCRVLGITADIADFKTLTVYLRDNVLNVAKNLVDYTIAIIKVISSGDFDDFLNRVVLTATDSESAKIHEISSKFLIVKTIPDVDAGTHEKVFKMRALESELAILSDQAKKFERKSLHYRAEILKAQIESTRVEYENKITDLTPRKESVMYMCTSDPGTGKSLNTFILRSGVARALKLDDNHAASAIHFWATGQSFQESFDSNKLCIIIDEFLSVNPDYDSTSGELANTLLLLGSPNPSMINQAFPDKKGKNTTKNILAVAVNTNASMTTIENLYPGGGGNIKRRVKWVSFIPQGTCCVEGQFRPDLAPEDQRTIKGLNKYIKVQVGIYNKKTKTVDYETMSLLQYADLVYNDINDRVNGKFIKVSKWLDSLSYYKGEKQSLSFETLSIFGLIISILFLIFTHPTVKFYLALISPWQWQIYWAYREFKLKKLEIQNQCISYVKLLPNLRLKEEIKIFGMECKEKSIRMQQYVDSIYDTHLSNEVKIFSMKCKNAFLMVQQFIKSKWFEAMLGFAGASVLVYSIQKTFPPNPKQFEDSDDEEDEKAERQGLKMPRQLPADFVTKYDVEIRDVADQLIPVLREPKGQGDLYYLHKTSTGMQAPALDKLRSNLAVMESVSEQGITTESCYGFRLGQSILTVDHLVSDGTSSIRSWNPSVPLQNTNFKFNKNIITSEPLNDFCLLPNMFPTGTRDVMKTLEQIEQVEIGDRVVLIHPDSSKDLHGTVINNKGIAQYEKYNTPCYVVQWDNGSTDRGWCGLPVLKSVSVNSYGFIGIVISAPIGTSGKGNITFISKLDVDYIKNKMLSNKFSLPGNFIATPQCTLLMEQEVPYVEKWPNHGLFSYKTSLDKFGFRVLGSSENQLPLGTSRLVRSPFYDEAQDFIEENCPGVQYAPAVLSNTVRWDDEKEINVWVSPYTYGMLRDNIGIGVVDFQKLREFGFGTLNYLEPKKSRILKIDESLLRRQGLAPVDPRKAATLPDPGKKGSFMLESYASGELERFADERLRVAVKTSLAAALSGGIGSVVSRASLKDEVISLEKNEGVKTRIFEGVASDDYLLLRMFLGDVIPNLLEELKKFGSCIGINASSPQWNWLHSRVSGNEKDGFRTSKDYRKMDKEMLYMCHVMALSIIFAYAKKCLELSGVGEMLSNALARILMASLQPQRQVDGAFIFGYAGNMSGDFLTTLVNTLVNMMYWWLIYAKKFNISFEIFYTEILAKMAFYGDDTSKFQLYKYPFTSSEIILEMSLLGQTMTDGGAQKSILTVDTEGGKTFLKRGFRMDKDGNCFCPLEVSSLAKSLLMFEETDAVKLRPNERHFSVLRALWDESFFHDDEIKAILRSLIRRCMKKLPPQFSEFTFETDEVLLARWKSGSLKIWEL